MFTLSSEKFVTCCYSYNCSKVKAFEGLLAIGWGDQRR